MATACKLPMMNENKIHTSRKDGPLKVKLGISKTIIRSKKKTAASVIEIDELPPTGCQDLLSVYTLGEELGHGTHGVTRSCRHNFTGEESACKSISKQGMTLQYIETVKTEIQIMLHLDTEDSIVRLKDVFEDEDSFHLVMERCFGGRLCDRLIKKEPYSEREAASLCRQIVEAVQTCHSAGVMHRDLKLDNILFSTEKEDSRIKLIDFGVSVFFKPGEVFGNLTGTFEYMAPEVYMGRYSHEADLWSVGVILYVLLSGRFPFRSFGTKDILDAVLDGVLDFSFAPWLQISYGAKDLIRKMLVLDPEKRLTASQVLSHPWIREVA